MFGWVALAPQRVASALAPSAERALATLDDDHLRIYARALVAAEDPRAFEVCRRALDKGLWSDGVPTQLARADPVAALPLLEARRARDPRNFEVLAAMGEAYLATRRATEATAALEGAIAASGGTWMPWNHDAWVGLARADPVAGLARVRACADQMSGAAGAGLLGDALAAIGRTAEARSAYDRAVEIEPDSTVWRTRRAALR